LVRADGLLGVGWFGVGWLGLLLHGAQLGIG
jgi:hypothetical protein